MKIKIHKDYKALIPKTVGDLATQSLKKIIPSVEEFTSISELDIIADDGKTLFNLRLNDIGELEISTGGSVVKHNKTMLDSKLVISPVSGNSINISRLKYK